MYATGLDFDGIHPILIWIDLSTIGTDFHPSPSLSMASAQGMKGDLATVDHSDMRGLVTDLTSLRRGAALLYGRGSALPKEDAT
jgi:hypothetical protein